ncbi:type II toxin-antitoxin system YoeB family toxin [Microcystis aeruginosa]|uniref:type II toxin-antitoxin system YoeB family toxin n=1 Tax=Microcystis aeruginosa TaxID=1126 RepID=UPI00287F9046|nr:type II toxin-antitoxin system YoeB family toxin [Microcystis aeruginosa]WNF14999.1 type II toxin-antitoxin system YoeB family toxin [Microcystis aeruginosa NRERC-214]
MRKVAFLTRSFDEFNQWAIADKKVYAKIVSLIKDVQREPFSGLGKPEALKPTFRTLSCHREKLRREKIKVSIKINIRSEKRHLRNSKAPKMASKPILNKEQ